MELVWKEPENSNTGKYNRGIKRSIYWELLEALEQRPGQWALVKENNRRPSNGLYALIRSKELPYEVTTRKNQDGTFNIYARRKIEEEQVQA